MALKMKIIEINRQKIFKQLQSSNKHTEIIENFYNQRIDLKNSNKKNKNYILMQQSKTKVPPQNLLKD